MSILKDTTPDSRIYLVYLIDRARGQYCLDLVENETELQSAIQAASARHARCTEGQHGKICPPFDCEIFRTRQDFKDFRAKLVAERAKYEAQEYREHVRKECANLTREVKNLKLAQGVCSIFDGKIINARFFNKLGAVCGCTVYENYSRLNFTNSDGLDMCVYTSKSAKCPTDWRWPSGSRLDGAAAAEVLENCIQDRMSKIKELRASVKYYAAYLRKVRKIEEQIKELTNTSSCVRNYAREKHLTGFYGAKYIWQ